MIKEFEVSPGHICWIHNSKKVEIYDSNVVQALADEKKNNVIVLRKLSEKSDLLELRVLEPEGNSIVDLKAPEKFTFSYLTLHPELGVAIVAGANEKVDGWYDWHFGFDKNAKSIFKHCPAY